MCFFLISSYNFFLSDLGICNAGLKNWHYVRWTGPIKSLSKRWIVTKNCFSKFRTIYDCWDFSMHVKVSLFVRQIIFKTFHAKNSVNWKYKYTVCPLKFSTHGKVFYYYFYGKKLFQINSTACSKTQNTTIRYHIF